jgi:hypothetical protein
MWTKILNIIISIVGMKVFLKKYIISSETIKENGKKITILTLNGSALLNDGAVTYHLAGGMCATVGNTVLVLDCAKSNTSKNDFGFFLNHEIGHLVLGHVAKAVKAGKGGTVLNIEDEIAADNYARQKGFETPDFRKLLTGVYGELATAGLISANDVADYVESTLEDHTSRM